ncbi:MAG TPA: hypothetical protein VHG28_22215 [Longimicrobiaceae bacterium]|nr:hypothetical protein [Longimicrobiaceae bacterium]
MLCWHWLEIISGSRATVQWMARCASQLVGFVGSRDFITATAARYALRSSLASLRQ